MEEVNKKKGYIPKEKRKKILLLADDLRTHSGIAHIARELVLNSAHHYNFCQIAGSINHPEKGKILDLSEDTNKSQKINDSSVVLYPSDGYGNPQLLREIIKREDPDAIMLLTDPRYFIWLFQMENEIRKTMPIMYLNIWDAANSPSFNLEYYQSCDLMMGISKQTHFGNENVLEMGKVPTKKLIK